MPNGVTILCDAALAAAVVLCMWGATDWLRADVLKVDRSSRITLAQALLGAAIASAAGAAVVVAMLMTAA